MSFTEMEKAFCVLEFDKNNPWTCVQRNFWSGFLKQPPDRRTIQKCHAKFKEEGCLCSWGVRILNICEKFNKTFIV